MRVVSRSVLKSSVRLLSVAAVAACLLPPRAAEAQTIELPGLNVQGTSIQARPVQAPPAPAAEATAPGQSPDQAPASDDTVNGTPYDQVGSAVSVVTRQDLDRQQIRTAVDALRSLPGVSVSQQGTPGNVTVVRIRGAESRHTLVLIDGVEVNSGTDGFFDFSNLNADDIDRIEVLRGPQSGLYGSGAIGGVVSITTRQARGPLTLTMRQEVGTQRSSGTTVQVSGGSEQAWGTVVVNGRRTDGFNIATSGDEKDGTSLRSFAFRGGVKLMPNLAVEATVREQKTHDDYDDLNGVYKGYLFVPSDAPFYGDARLRVGSLQATWETFDKRWVHKFSLSGAETLRNDVSFGSSETESRNSKYGYTSTIRLDGPPGSPIRHFITGMVEQRNETFQQPAFSAQRYERDRTSAVGEVRGEYFKSLFLTGTVRHDENSTTQDFTTWHTSASLKVPSTVFRLHASAGSGVKYPSFGDLYGFYIGFVPNPNLKPEESVGWDAGIETTLLNGRATVDITYFSTNLKREIAFDNTGGVYTLFNRPGDSTHKGLEVASRFAVGGGLSLGAAYTYLDAREDTGLQEVRRPPHSARFDANYAFQGGRGNINVAAIYNGSMRDLALDAGFNTVRVLLDDYWLVNLAASYKVAPGVELFARVQNALDDKYQEVFAYNATPGTSVFGGIKLTLGGPEGVGGSFVK